MYIVLLIFLIYDVKSECHSDQFTCADGKCILQNWICDGARDCIDGSDETHEACDQHKSTNSPCYGNQPECRKHGSLRCIPHEWLCDGHPDCDSGEDETNCTSVEWLRRPESLIENYHRMFSTSTEDSTYCDYGYFKCNSTSQCVQRDKLCDAVRDCSDGSDEEPKVCGTTIQTEKIEEIPETTISTRAEITSTISSTTLESSTPFITTTLDNEVTSQEIGSIITTFIPSTERTTIPDEDAIPPYLIKAIQPPVRQTTEEFSTTTTPTTRLETTTETVLTTKYFQVEELDNPTTLGLTTAEVSSRTSRQFVRQTGLRDSPVDNSVNSSEITKKPVNFFKGIPIKPINTTHT